MQNDTSRQLLLLGARLLAKANKPDNDASVRGGDNNGSKGNDADSQNNDTKTPSIRNHD